VAAVADEQRLDAAIRTLEPDHRHGRIDDPARNPPVLADRRLRTERPGKDDRLDRLGRRSHRFGGNRRDAIEVIAIGPAQPPVRHGAGSAVGVGAGDADTITGDAAQRFGPAADRRDHFRFEVDEVEGHERRRVRQRRVLSPDHRLDEEIVVRSAHRLDPGDEAAEIESNRRRDHV